MRMLNALKREVQQANEQKAVASSNKSNEKGDFNEGLLDGPKKAAA